MNSRTAKLTASLTPRPVQSFHGLDSRDLMNKILSMGYQTMTLDGAFIENFYEGIFLFVEEDVQFLVNAYLYLEKLIETQDRYQHGTCLNDGRFCITATYDTKIVEIKFQFCPDLNVANLVINTMIVSNDEYVYWWRSIAHEVLSLVTV